MWKVYLIKRNIRGEKRYFTSFQGAVLTGLYYIVVQKEVSFLWRQNLLSQTADGATCRLTSQLLYLQKVDT